MRWILLIVVLSTMRYNTYAQSINIPEDFKWKNRLLLLFAPSSNNPMIQQQYDLLEADQSGLNDRDLLIFQIFSDRVAGHEAGQFSSAQKLRQQYRISEDEFAVLLIGKDGSEKLRKRGELLEQQELYGTIDAMPMRRREMQEKGGS